MTFYSPANLPEGFVTIDELEDFWVQAVAIQKTVFKACHVDSNIAATELGARRFKREIYLDLAEDLHAEANGWYDIRDTHDGRTAVFVPPTLAGN